MPRVVRALAAMCASRLARDDWPMWVRLWDSMIVDAAPPLPEVGSVLSSVGIRVRGVPTDAEPGSPDGIVEVQGTGSTGPQHVEYRLTGVASDAREFDADTSREGNRHAGAEFVLTVNGDGFQVQFDGRARDVLPDSRVTVAGNLALVREYEWDAFRLGDSRADWLVGAVVTLDGGDAMLYLAHPTTE
jgi:hypothetical protein